MQSLPPIKEELRETLERAREIAATIVEPRLPDEAWEAYLKAADELGIPREAMAQALRERRPMLAVAPEVGERVFAPSVDGFWYPAVITGTSRHTVSVRFVKGGDHTCAVADLRPLALVPGRKLQVEWPNWGWATVTIEEYDRELDEIKVTDGWSSKELSLDAARLTPQIATPPVKKGGAVVMLSRAALVRWGLLTGGGGMAVGALLARLLGLLG